MIGPIISKTGPRTQHEHATLLHPWPFKLSINQKRRISNPRPYQKDQGRDIRTRENEHYKQEHEQCKHENGAPLGFGMASNMASTALSSCVLSPSSL